MMISGWQITISREDITFWIALLAFSLGVLNFSVDLWRNRVRLRVLPKLYLGDRHGSFSWDRPNDEWLKQQGLTGKALFCIEVQNIGHKPVTVSSVGFMRHKSEALCTVGHPIFQDGGNLPRRLESQSSFTAYTSFSPEELWQDYGPVDKAFAFTEADKMFQGSSPILEDLKAKLRTT
jgi:hypothetical protein